ncbi:MAG: hypothetical protein IJ300_11325 [Clostridia bacterium]|nr:hypothetical protein [Clostridia bacterium]
MLDGFILFGILFSGALLIAGALGFVVDKLAACKWVGKAVERMTRTE